jgi:hypothetical protein
VGFGVVQCPPNLLVFPAACGRQSQQWHLVSIQDRVLERVWCLLVRVVLVESGAVDLDAESVNLNEAPSRGSY